MIVLFIVIANEVLKCYGVRFCEPVYGVELVRLWEAGFAEVMFEGIIGGAITKVYRMSKDKIDKPHEKDREIKE